MACHRDVAGWRRRASAYGHRECRSRCFHRDPHARGSGNSDRSGGRHPSLDGDCDGNRDGNANRHANRNTNGNTNGNSNTNTNTNSNTTI